MDTNPPIRDASHWHDTHLAETYKSLITISVEGFKFAALANGGASVALLAYLGAVAGKGATVPDLSGAMRFFLVGLLACGVAMLAGYLTQLRLFNESISPAANAPPARPIHGAFLRMGVVFYFASLVGFGSGAFVAVNRFTRLSTPEETARGAPSRPASSPVCKN